MRESVRERAFRTIRSEVQRSIHVNAPPRKAYEFVRDLENLPRFMEHVKNVSTQDEKRSHWV